MSTSTQILVVSDSHWNTSALDVIVRQFADVKCIFHLGDNVEDAAYLSEKLPDAGVYSVKGNCDIGSSGRIFLHANVLGHSFILTHGHTLDVKFDEDRIYRFAVDNEADVMLFGHTHIPLIEQRGDVLLVNPGSAGDPRQKEYTVALLNVTEMSVDPEIVPLKLKRKYWK